MTFLPYDPVKEALDANLDGDYSDLARTKKDGAKARPKPAQSFR
jgi:hypothetical protein